jgi:hypothetical protein
MCSAHCVVRVLATPSGRSAGYAPPVEAFIRTGEVQPGEPHSAFRALVHSSAMCLNGYSPTKPADRATEAPFWMRFSSADRRFSGER